MSHSDPFVCTGCIDEPGIQDFIENIKVDQECSYCENKDIPVAALDDVTDHMESCIKEEYDDTNEWAVYDSESGYRVRALPQDWGGKDAPDHEAAGLPGGAGNAAPGTVRAE